MNTKLKFKRVDIRVHHDKGMIIVFIEVKYPKWIDDYCSFYKGHNLNKTFIGISRLKANDVFNYKKGVHIAETKAVTLAKKHYFKFLKYANKRMTRDMEYMSSCAIKEYNSIKYNEEYVRNQ